MSPSLISHISNSRVGALIEKEGPHNAQCSVPLNFIVLCCTMTMKTILFFSMFTVAQSSLVFRPLHLGNNNKINTWNSAKSRGSEGTICWLQSVIWCWMFVLTLAMAWPFRIHNGLLWGDTEGDQIRAAMSAGKVLIAPWPFLLSGCQHLVFFHLTIWPDKQQYCCT